jgi:sensor c-di-GMP phosphodiesterase-like protein
VTRSLTNILLVLGALVLTAAPLGLLRWHLHSHAVSQAERTLDGLADRMLANVESVLAEGADALAASAAELRDTCSSATRASLAAAVQNAAYVRSILAIDVEGRPTCVSGEAPRSLSPAPNWRPTRERDLSIAAVASDRDRVTLLLRRDSASRAAVAVLAPGTHLLDVTPPDWRNAILGTISLDDGRVIGSLPRPPEADQLAGSGALLSAERSSERFPVKVSLAVPASIAWQGFRTLGLVADIGGGIMALLFIAIVVQAVRRPRSIEDALQRGIRKQEFVPFYQPVFDIQSGRLVGAEVLIRWRRNDGTMVPPGAFIQQAEESGLAVEMTRQLMIKTRDEMGPLYEGRPGLKLAFNLFADHFSDLSIVDEVRRTFRSGGVRFTQLVFEVTERYPLPNLNRAKLAITGLQELGCRVALDDAGTGHGGLAYLQKLGMDQIKIDKLFVDTVTASSVSAPIIDSLVELGRSLGMEIVAEGVETIDQLHYLRTRGVHAAQGFLFAAPLPGPAYAKLVVALSSNPEPAAVGIEPAKAA